MMNNVNWKLNSNNENEIIQADHDDSGVKNIEAYNFSQIKGVDQKIIEKLKGLLLRYNKVFNERPNGEWV